jgi:hypothetical protein
MIIEDQPKAPTAAVPWEDYVGQANAELANLLASGADEPQLHGWLERHPAWVPGVDGGRGSEGHHGPLHGAVVSQPPLRGLGIRVPDFLCLTKTSATVTPVLVEIEDPAKQWFTKDGQPTAEFTQAQDQLREWRSWFNSSGNQQVFIDTYDLPTDWRRLAFRPLYRLVYGRTHEFGRHGRHADGDRLNRKRADLAHPDEEYRTWDSIAAARPQTRSVITAHVGVSGYQAIAVPDTFDLADDLHNSCERVRGLDDAIDANDRIPDERRTWLKGRAAWWREEHARRAAGGGIRLRRT